MGLHCRLGRVRPRHALAHLTIACTSALAVLTAACARSTAPPASSASSTAAPAVTWQHTTSPVGAIQFPAMPSPAATIVMAAALAKRDLRR